MDQVIKALEPKASPNFLFYLMVCFSKLNCDGDSHFPTQLEWKEISTGSKMTNRRKKHRKFSYSQQKKSPLGLHNTKHSICRTQANSMKSGKAIRILQSNNRCGH